MRKDFMMTIDICDEEVLKRVCVLVRRMQVLMQEDEEEKLSLVVGKQK